MQKSVSLLLLATLSVGTAWAGSFTVNPVRLALSLAQKTTAVEVTNTGRQATVVQAVLKRWVQRGGENIYTATKDLLATPPIFNIAPKDSQIVRVGLLKQPGERIERAYRLFLTEVPPAPHSGFVGLQVALRVSIPIFVAPRLGPVAPKLVWRLERHGAKSLKLVADNLGTGHARVTDLSLVARPKGPGLAEITADNGYVLPHAEHVWNVRPKTRIKTGQTLFIRGKTSHGVFQTQLSWAQ